MDKYSVYVIVVYVVTLVLLGAYLGWLWLRLRAARDEAELTTPSHLKSAPTTGQRRG
ncbi:hypothetical protein [Deinococcus puniceus]|nr:hypothetical protein [Deinococcus puniceus]